MMVKGRGEMKALWFENGVVKMMDQRLLPRELRIIDVGTLDETIIAIKDMAVRGAPAIGVAAAWGMVLAVSAKIAPAEAGRRLKSSRPTAQDLFHAVDFMLSRIASGESPESPVSAAQGYEDSIVEKCRRIGEAGAPLIEEGMGVLTHCNAGALATVDWGTALAPMRAARRSGRNFFVYADETRPRLQGARLTSWELINEDIPCAVIADNAAGHYMRLGKIALVITGADRIVANGDAANKIGTYEKAVVARENGIPFYIAAPASTFDLSLPDGSRIPIEERSEDEVHFVGKERVTPVGAKALNPAFDVTPARYIKGYITEFGIIQVKDFERVLK